MSTSATTIDEANALLAADGDEAGLPTFEASDPPSDPPSSNGDEQAETATEAPTAAGQRAERRWYPLHPA